MVYTFKSKEPSSSCHVKWIIEFSILKVKVLYEERKKYVLADAWSRLDVDKNNNNSNKDINGPNLNNKNIDKYSYNVDRNNNLNDNNNLNETMITNKIQ